jgi:putative OPT family oligopeptide transporter
VIYLAAFICTAACIAGDNLQDLKCGHVVGATPWRQQLCLVLGTIASAAVIPIVLGVLDRGTGIGRPSAAAIAAAAAATPPVEAKGLDAPQANLMKDLSTGIFGGSTDWFFILLGCGLAVLIIALDEYLKRRKASFRTPILAVAVGIYLPFGVSVLIFVGGMLSWLVSKLFAARSEHDRISLENSGLLLASGLITGEAIVGVLLAGVIAFDQEALPENHAPWAGTAAMLATLGMIAYLFFRTPAGARAMRG